MALQAFLPMWDRRRVGAGSGKHKPSRHYSGFVARGATTSNTDDTVPLAAGPLTGRFYFFFYLCHTVPRGGRRECGSAEAYALLSIES